MSDPFGQPQQPEQSPPPPPPPPGQPYGGPGFGFRPKHPQATTALVLGILGIVFCGVLAPFAWVIGGRAVKEIDANPAAFDGRGEANAGRILGIVGTVLLIVGVIVAVIYVVAIVLFVTASPEFSSEYSSTLGLL